MKKAVFFCFFLCFSLCWSIQCYHCNSALAGEEDCVLNPPPTKYLQECISNGVSLTVLNACVRSHQITPSNTKHKPDGEDVSYIIRKCTFSPKEWEVEECNQGHCVYDTYCLTVCPSRQTSRFQNKRWLGALVQVPRSPCSRPPMATPQQSWFYQ